MAAEIFDLDLIKSQPVFRKYRERNCGIVNSHLLSDGSLCVVNPVLKAEWLVVHGVVVEAVAVLLPCAA